MRGFRAVAGLAGLGVMTVTVSAAPLPAEPRPVTLDDLMGLASIVDVEISPDGGSVAYAVSRPSLEANRHEVALFVVAAGGGEPRRLGVNEYAWAPDGRSIYLLGNDGAFGRRERMFEQPILRLSLAAG